MGRVLNCDATANQIVDRYRQVVESGDNETISRVADAIEVDPTWKTFKADFRRMASQVKINTSSEIVPRPKRKTPKSKPGPLSEEDMRREVWNALKHHRDPYELTKSKLTHLKEVEALAKQRYPDSAYASGEVLCDILAACVNRVEERATTRGTASKSSYLIKQIASGCTMTRASKASASAESTSPEPIGPKP